MRQAVSAEWAASAEANLAREREAVTAAPEVARVVMVPEGQVVARRAMEATGHRRMDRHRSVHPSPPESQIGMNPDGSISHNRVPIGPQPIGPTSPTNDTDPTSNPPPGDGTPASVGQPTGEHAPAGDAEPNSPPQGASGPSPSDATPPVDPSTASNPKAGASGPFDGTDPSSPIGGSKFGETEETDLITPAASTPAHFDGATPPVHTINASGNPIPRKPD